MVKLVLLGSEIRLIKGLTTHTALNNQAITAIFSYLDRNINHREIGSIRAAKGKYAGTEAASVAEVNELLAKYGRLEARARQIGILPSDIKTTRIEKALELLKTAVVVYNNPTLAFRTEIFIVNAIIAWTYAMHAFYFSIGKIPIYRDADGKPILTDGSPKYWELSTCIAKNECPLAQGEKNNLRYLIALRNEIEHRMSRDIDDHVRGKVQACAINFSQFCETKFGPAYSLRYDLGFAIQFSIITMESPNAETATEALPESIKTVNKLVEDGLSPEDYNDQKYSFRVYVIPKTVNNPKKADQAVTFVPAGSQMEMAIKHVERPKQRANELISELCKEGLAASMADFITFWKKGDLKNKKKGLVVELGGQWFWYPEAVELYRAYLKPAGPAAA